MNRSTSRASTPRAIAAVGNCERDFRWTTINRSDRLGEARRNESSGAAMDGRTVLPALASPNHRFELRRGTRKFTSKALLIAEVVQFFLESSIRLAFEYLRRDEA